MTVPTFNIPSESQSSLSNIIEQENNVTKVETLRTKDDFFADVQKMVKTGNFADQNEAILETAKYANSKGVQYEGINYDELFESTTKDINEKEVEQEIKDSGVLSAVGEGLTSFKEGTEDVIGGAVSNIPNIIGNTFGFVADVLTPKEFEGLGDAFREGGIKDQKQLQDMLGVNPESFATSAGEFGADFGTLLLPGGQAKLLTKFPQAGEKIAKLGTVIDNISQKAPKIFNILKSGLTGAKEVGKFEVVTEGEVTPEGLAVGAVANPLIGKAIQGIGTISKGIAQKLELAGLLNPAKLDKVAKQLKTDGLEESSAVADFLLKKNIKGNKESIVKDLFADATKSRKAVDSKLKSITKESFDESSQKALELLKSNLAGKAGLEDDLAKIVKLEEKLQTKGLKTFEKNEIKRDLDKFINIFKDNGEIIAGTNKLGASNIRAGVQKQIENEAKEAGIKNIKDLNKNTQVSFTLAEAIARKDSADQAASLARTLLPGAALGGIATEGDIYDRLKGAVLGALVGKIAGSTTVKTSIANKLNKLSSLDKQSLIQFIETKGATPISSEIIDLIEK